MRERKRRRGRQQLTVCIAARCNEATIFCAVDRMITVGDIEMESPVPKLVMLTNSIVFMPSDEDAAFHTEIIADAYFIIKKRIDDDPGQWWTVKEVVDLYIEKRTAHKTARAERDILRPLGLTNVSFHEQQKTMDPDLVKQIAVDLVNYKLPYLSAIIAGVDPTGCHMYVVHTGESGNIETGCCDAFGYAAIGGGARHATAELLKAQQSWRATLPTTLWNVYLAKKRSEVAPGVGETTDVLMIGPGLGSNTLFNEKVVEQLESVYIKTREHEEKGRQNAADEVTSYVKKLTADQSKAQASPAAPAIGPPPQLTESKGPAADGKQE